MEPKPSQNNSNKQMNDNSTNKQINKQTQLMHSFLGNCINQFIEVHLLVATTVHIEWLIPTIHCKPLVNFWFDSTWLENQVLVREI